MKNNLSKDQNTTTSVRSRSIRSIWTALLICICLLGFAGILSGVLTLILILSIFGFGTIARKKFDF